jgi:uncharacterized protein
MNVGQAAQAGTEIHAGVCETHAATVLFIAERAYKLKKPVNLGFLDFSALHMRERACRRETELNRRFAPDVYLGVAEVRDPADQICDYLVVMRRMPLDRRLSALIQAGASVADPLRAVARLLAAQHASADRSPEIARQGGRDAMRDRWAANLTQIREVGNEVLERRVIDDIERLASKFLTAREPMFGKRISDGRIVDGHGDLLADDIFCLGDGPRVLDCLEFDDRLRWVDGLDDASFLAMDLERLGAPRLAERFTGWYIEFSADPAPTSLRHHYVAYRALVRAKVACVRVTQGEPAYVAEGRQLAEMTLRHLQAGAVTLTIIGGLPGTGKTALAGELADRLGFVVLNSDRIRKELAGIPPEEHRRAPYETGIYSHTWTERTYNEMLARAGRLLRLGESVILDASWTSPAHRAAAAAAAEASAADLVQLRCMAAEEVAAKRLAARTRGVSDADQPIAALMASRLQAWPDAIAVDTGRDGGQLMAGTGCSGSAVRQALEAIRPHGPEHTWRPLRPYMLPD